MYTIIDHYVTLSLYIQINSGVHSRHRTTAFAGSYVHGLITLENFHTFHMNKKKKKGRVERKSGISVQFTTCRSEIRLCKQDATRTECASTLYT